VQSFGTTTNQGYPMKPTKKLTIRKVTLKNLTVKTSIHAGLVKQTSRDVPCESAPNLCVSDVRLKKTVRSID
jgi:hypothetical protein